MSSIRAKAIGYGLTAVAAALLASACATDAGVINPDAKLSSDQYPLAVTTAPTGVQLAAHDFGLSPQQADALRDLVADWRANGEGMIVIEAPACACDDAAATAYDARDALVAFGAPADQIRMLGYDADGGAPIRVSFQRLSAQTYACGTNWTDVTTLKNGAPNSNFGCAVNSNLAAMIDNPADIVRPRAADPADAARREVVIQHYRAGEVTSSAVDPNADGKVSNAVN